MAGVTQAKAWFGKKRGCSSLTCDQLSGSIRHGWLSNLDKLNHQCIVIDIGSLDETDFDWIPIDPTNSMLNLVVFVQRAPNPSEFAPACTRGPKRPKQTCTNSRPEALVCKLRTGTNLHKFAPPRGRLRSGGPTRGGGCKFGYVWSPLKLVVH